MARRFILARCTSTSSNKLFPILRREFSKSISSLDYLSGRQLQFLVTIEAVEPEFAEFSQGEVIAAEGSVSDRVLLLVEGEALVQVRGVEVGKVLQGEIFGVKSALTGSARNATVRCHSSRCFVMSLAKEQFRDLVRERPDVVEALIDHLIRVIGELNEVVVSQKQEMRTS